MFPVYHNCRQDIYRVVVQKQQAMASPLWRETVPTAHREVYELLLILMAYDTIFVLYKNNIINSHIKIIN